MSDKVREYCHKYIITTDQIKNFQDLFLAEIKKGLGKFTHDNADVKCHISYVTDIPDGTERGKYLAIDLGGTDFRVVLIDLIGANNIEMKSKIFAIPRNLLTDTGDKLFDHIVSCIAEFIDIHSLKNDILPMAFTFSFPIKQLGLFNGELVKWTKGFNCSDVVGENVVDLLRKAVERRGNLKINTVALLNDTTGTLMSCALENKNCKIGLIVGSGCNACYLEDISEVENWDKSQSNANKVIINCELGAFGNSGTIDHFRTNEDKIIDEKSINKGQQVFEKMVAGMYMGEIVRLIILKLIQDKILFNGQNSDVLEKSDSFKTAYISEIESDPPQIYTNCKRILKELRLDKNATEDDYANIVYICQCISRRSAYLVSAVIVCIMHKIKETNITIGVDGSVYRLHPFYHKLMVAKISELVSPDVNFEIMLSEDGSGKGAAVIAAVAVRLST